MRRLLLFLTISLIALFSISAEVPTDSEIEEVYREQPNKIYMMVQRLYIIEHAKPDITFPDLVVTEKKDGGGVVAFSGPMHIIIGGEKESLEYEIKLEPKGVIMASSPDTGPTWSTVGLGAGIGLSVGVIVGLVFHFTN